MPSQNTLVWAGAAASAIVVAGASALYWTHPGFLWRNAAVAPVVASAPAEPKPQSAPAERKPPLRLRPRPAGGKGRRAVRARRSRARGQSAGQAAKPPKPPPKPQQRQRRSSRPSTS